MRIAVYMYIFLHVMVHTVGNNNAVGSRCVNTDVLPRECDILSEPVGFASDYRYIDSFEHPTHIGGKDLGNSENLEYLTKLKMNVPSKKKVLRCFFNDSRGRNQNLLVKRLESLDTPRKLIMANSDDPDQTPHGSLSDQGRHCLQNNALLKFE